MSEPTLHLIDLDIIELGYTKFIASWLYSGPEGNFLIDPGPACTIPVLISALRSKGIETLDHILLTHIHMDHAGGIGHLLRYFPGTKVICHEKGVRHLVDPKRLWEGSKAVIGNVADVYGKILPIPKDNVMVTKKIPFGDGIEVIPTPGHASHHQCFAFRDWFFAGELFGTHVHLENELYLRPATPPRFVLEDYLASMEEVEPHLRKEICFAHYGRSREPERILKAAMDQLKLWVRLVSENRSEKDIDDILVVLLREDELSQRITKIPYMLRKRELRFARNSIEGILRYLESK